MKHEIFVRMELTVVEFDDLFAVVENYIAESDQEKLRSLKGQQAFRVRNMLALVSDDLSKE